MSRAEGSSAAAAFCRIESVLQSHKKIKLCFIAFSTFSCSPSAAFHFRLSLLPALRAVYVAGLFSCCSRFYSGHFGRADEINWNAAGDKTTAILMHASCQMPLCRWTLFAFKYDSIKFQDNCDLQSPALLCACECAFVFTYFYVIFAVRYHSSKSLTRTFCINVQR